MTEKLKTLMDRATDVEFAAVDLAAVVQDGDRVVRRRRLSLVAGTAAVVLVAGGVALATDHGDDRGDDRTPVVDAPRVTDPTWVEGSVLHSPDRQVDLGTKVRGYVRTSAGFAFLAEDGAVLGYRNGEVRTLGRAWPAGAKEGGDGVRLVADQEDGVVGWVDMTGPVPAFVVHDLVTGDERRFDEHLDAGMKGELPDQATFFALDAGTAYWLDRRGTVMTDLATGRAQVLADATHLQWIGDVRRGMRVQLVESATGGDEGMELVDPSGRSLISYRDLGSPGLLSPSGTWVTAYDRGLVWNVADRRAVRLVAPSGTDNSGDPIAYEWLDDDTVAAVIEGENDKPTLATCEVPAGTCTSAATELDYRTLVLPGRLPG